MVDEPDNIVLIYLRRMDEKIDRLADDMRDMKVRLTAVEESVVGVQRRMDRLEARIERIEKRLDLVKRRTEDR
jgi:predicted  nucleic acid-binding Zn-ribbon protein